jgi:hypothetical protein
LRDDPRFEQIVASLAEKEKLYAPNDKQDIGEQTPHPQRRRACLQAFFLPCTSWDAMFARFPPT